MVSNLKNLLTLKTFGIHVGKPVSMCERSLEPDLSWLDELNNNSDYDYNSDYDN